MGAGRCRNVEQPAKENILGFLFIIIIITTTTTTTTTTPTTTTTTTCECGNEPSGSIKCGEFLDCLASQERLCSME